MLAIALSVMFGLIAFVAVAEVCTSIRLGVTRGRVILAELDGAKVRDAMRRPALRPVLPLRLAAA